MLVVRSIMLPTITKLAILFSGNAGNPPYISPQIGLAGGFLV
jgi:hypothetical protein